MVTVELAVAIPAVVLVLAFCLSGITAVSAQVRCIDAARAGARALARGDDPEAVRALMADAAPPGAEFDIERTGDSVTVTVTVTAGGFGGLLPRWPVRASARGQLEGVGGSFAVGP